MIETPRHELDQAIDRVAAKMVAAPGADDLLRQVIARLPERKTTPWFMTMRVQVAAAAALVLVAFLYPRASRESASIESAPLALAKPIAVRPEAPVREPVVAARHRLPTSDSRLPAAALDRPDHERSLPPVSAIEALELTDIAAPAMALDAPATLEPLVLTDLALEPKGEK